MRDAVPHICIKALAAKMHLYAPEMLLLALPHSKCGQANTDLLCGLLCQLRPHSTLIVVGSPLVHP